MIYWLTGQPGAGKTTLVNKLLDHFDEKNTIIIDGDDLRYVFDNKDYSENGRRKNIERAQDISLFLNRKGYTVLVALVSPYKNQRDIFKKLGDVVEIYVHTSEDRGRNNFHVHNYEPPTENFTNYYCCLEPFNPGMDKHVDVNVNQKLVIESEENVLIKTLIGQTQKNVDLEDTHVWLFENFDKIILLDRLDKQLQLESFSYQSYNKGNWHEKKRYRMEMVPKDIIDTNIKRLEHSTNKINELENKNFPYGKKYRINVNKPKSII